MWEGGPVSQPHPHPEATGSRPSSMLLKNLDT
jgi:hypothetical protein